MSEDVWQGQAFICASTLGQLLSSACYFFLCSARFLLLGFCPQPHMDMDECRSVLLACSCYTQRAFDSIRLNS